MIARIGGNDGLIVVANLEYWQSASIRSEKSSSGVQEVELTRTLKSSVPRMDPAELVSGKDLITSCRACLSGIGCR